VIRVVTNSFGASKFSNDIALLQLQQPLHLDGKRIAPVCLPQPGQQYSNGESPQPGQQYSNGEFPSARKAVQQW
jgi:hypothetical protein